MKTEKVKKPNITETILNAVIFLILRVVVGGSFAVWIGIEYLKMKEPLVRHQGLSEKQATIVLVVEFTIIVIFLYDFVIKKSIEKYSNKRSEGKFVDEGGYFHTTRHT